MLHILTAANMGAMVRSRSGVRSFACRKLSPPDMLYQIQQEMRFLLPCRATSLTFRGVGEQEMSSSYIFIVLSPRMTIFPTSYCTLHTTWKARVGPQGSQKFSRRRSWTVSKTSRSLFDPLGSVRSKENKTIEIEIILQTKMNMYIQ